MIAYRRWDEGEIYPGPFDERDAYLGNGWYLDNWSTRQSAGRMAALLHTMEPSPTCEYRLLAPDTGRVDLRVLRSP